MTFPTLYQRSNAGAIQMWSISSEYHIAGGLVRTVWGQVNGKLQETVDVITEGKNAGRANATTALEQAELEAESKWTKQLKKGYVKTLAEAEAGTVDALVGGGIPPMLAPSKLYPHFASKLSWPVYVDPKLDGTRCIAVIKDGVCTLWSRTRKPINSVPHIIKAIEALGLSDAILDGELYADKFSADFEKLISIVRKDEAAPGHEQIQYWVYDYPSCPLTFAGRARALAVDLGKRDPNVIVMVPHVLAEDHDQVMAIHEQNLAAGFEGSMVRGDGPYQQDRRSYYLQKLKNMVDSEFEVVGAEEGRGKDAGTVGAFVCVTPKGKEFRCRLKSSYDRRRELFENPDQWQGRVLTVVYQNLTSDGIPRFPIGKGFRAD